MVLIRFLLLLCYSINYISILGDSADFDRADYALDLVLQTSGNEYIDEKDEFIDFLSERKRYLRELIHYIEEHYPDSYYALAEHSTAPYENSCGKISKLAPITKIEDELKQVVDLDKQSLETKDQCSLYSSAIFHGNSILDNLAVGWRRHKKIFRIIILITNYWDNWDQKKVQSHCDSPLPQAFMKRLVSARTGWGALVTSDVECLWYNIAYDANYTKTVRVFNLQRYKEDVLQLIDTLVQYLKELHDTELKPTNITPLVPLDILPLSSATSINSIQLFFILLLSIIMIKVIG